MSDRDRERHASWYERKKQDPAWVEKRRAYSRAHRARRHAADPAAAREQDLAAERKRLYGLDEEAFVRLWNKQDARCAICRCDLSQLPARQQHVDHDHRTGKVRGILCQKCNQGLGMLGDTEAALVRALNYLRGSMRPPIPTRDELEAALRQHRGVVKLVAAHFNRNRLQVHRWCNHYGLVPKDYRILLKAA